MQTHFEAIAAFWPLLAIYLFRFRVTFSDPESQHN